LKAKLSANSNDEHTFLVKSNDDQRKSVAPVNGFKKKKTVYH